MSRSLKSVLSAKGLFFTGLAELAVPKIRPPGARFCDGFFLTNDRLQISRLIGAYAEQIGSVEHTFLTKDGGILVYSHREFAIGDKPEESMNAEIIKCIRVVQGLLNNLWLLKDNSGMQDIGRISANVDGRIVVNSNSWKVRYSKSDGVCTRTAFSAEEIATTCQFPIKDSDEDSLEKSIPLIDEERRTVSTTKLTSGSLRYQRFNYFIQIARSSPDVAIKVVNYCSALEAMVSSSQSELTHQVSERVACLFYPPGEDRLEMFRKIKVAYAFRSKAVHGATVKGKEFETLIESSIYLDEVCRSLTMNYLDSSVGLAAAIEAGNDEFNVFWQKQVFLPYAAEQADSNTDYL